MSSKVFDKTLKIGKRIVKKLVRWTEFYNDRMSLSHLLFEKNISQPSSCSSFDFGCPTGKNFEGIRTNFVIVPVRNNLFVFIVFSFISPKFKGG